MRKQSENKNQNQEIISAIASFITQRVQKALAEMKKEDCEEWVRAFGDARENLPRVIASFIVMQKAGMTTAEGAYGKVKQIEAHPALIALFVARLPPYEYCKRNFYSGQLLQVYNKAFDSVPRAYKYSREARYVTVEIKGNSIATIKAGSARLGTTESRPLSRWLLTKDRKDIIADCVATGRAWTLQTLK